MSIKVQHKNIKTYVFFLLLNLISVFFNLIFAIKSGKQGRDKKKTGMERGVEHTGRGMLFNPSINAIHYCVCICCIKCMWRIGQCIVQSFNVGDKMVVGGIWRR